MAVKPPFRLFIIILRDSIVNTAARTFVGKQGIYSVVDYCC